MEKMGERQQVVGGGGGKEEEGGTPWDGWQCLEIVLVVITEAGATGI